MSYTGVKGMLLLKWQVSTVPEMRFYSKAEPVGHISNKFEYRMPKGIKH